MSTEKKQMNPHQACQIEIHRLLDEIEQSTHSISVATRDCNGEPNNGWTPDLKTASAEARSIFWKASKIRALIDADGCQREIDECEGPAL